MVNNGLVIRLKIPFPEKGIIFNRLIVNCTGMKIPCPADEKLQPFFSLRPSKRPHRS
jgi:hypothetical protein